MNLCWETVNVWYDWFIFHMSPVYGLCGADLSWQGKEIFWPPEYKCGHGSKDPYPYQLNLFQNDHFFSHNYTIFYYVICFDYLNI